MFYEHCWQFIKVGEKLPCLKSVDILTQTKESNQKDKRKSFKVKYFMIATMGCYQTLKNKTTMTKEDVEWRIMITHNCKMKKMKNVLIKKRFICFYSKEEISFHPCHPRVVGVFVQCQFLLVHLSHDLIWLDD